MIDIGVVHGRFQPLHLKHMEYILAAKMRCRKLYIGITNPDNLHTRESVHDIRRSERSANPLTYFERYEMIRGAMAEFCPSRSAARNTFSSMCQRTLSILWGSVMNGMKKNTRY